jgi:hypothetical protein
MIPGTRRCSGTSAWTPALEQRKMQGALGICSTWSRLRWLLIHVSRIRLQGDRLCIGLAVQGQAHSVLAGRELRSPSVRGAFGSRWCGRHGRSTGIGLSRGGGAGAGCVKSETLHSSGCCWRRSRLFPNRLNVYRLGIYWPDPRIAGGACSHNSGAIKQLQFERLRCRDLKPIVEQDAGGRIQILWFLMRHGSAILAAGPHDVYFAGLKEPDI